jgi:hypothetical protein
MDELAAAFTTHLATLKRGVRCGACGGTDLQFNRLAMLPDMSFDQAAANECTPIALLMCRACLHLMPFAWIPITESVAKSKPGG